MKQMDLILIPIDRRSKHWVLANIGLFRKEFAFIDPMKEDNGLDVINKLNQWLADEVRTKFADTCAIKLLKYGFELQLRR